MQLACVELRQVSHQLDRRPPTVASEINDRVRELVVSEVRQRGERHDLAMAYALPCFATAAAAFFAASGSPR